MFKAKIRGLIVALALIFVIIPLLNLLWGFVINIPSWIYYSCCGIGIILIAITMWVDNANTKDRQNREKTNQELFQEFESVLGKNPIETKKTYLEFITAVNDYNFHTRLTENSNDQQLTEKRNVVYDFAIKLYGKPYFQADLTKRIEDRIYSLEREQRDEVVKEFDKKIAEDPEGTRALYGQLITDVKSNPKKAIEISERLFGEKLLVHRYAIKEIRYNSEALKKIEDDITIAKAIEIFELRIKEDPEETRRLYQELLYVIANISIKPVSEKPYEFQRAFEISSRLFGERLGVDKLEILINKLDIESH